MDPMAHTCRHACLLSPHTHTLQPPTNPQRTEGGKKKEEKKRQSEWERAVIMVVTVNNGMAAGLKQITCRWFYYVPPQRSCSHCLLLGSCSLRTHPMKWGFNYVYRLCDRLQYRERFLRWLVPIEKWSWCDVNPGEDAPGADLRTSEGGQGRL